MNDDGFALFLRRIARTPLLTASEERALAYRCERGDLAAKDRMIEANLRLVVHIAKRYQREHNPLQPRCPTSCRRARWGWSARSRSSTRAPATASRPTRRSGSGRPSAGRSRRRAARSGAVPMISGCAPRQAACETRIRARARGSGPAPRLLTLRDGAQAARAARHAALDATRRSGRAKIALGTLIAASTGQRRRRDRRRAWLAAGALDPDERHVLTLRFGLDGGEPADPRRDRADHAGGGRARSVTSRNAGCASCVGRPGSPPVQQRKRRLCPRARSPCSGPRGAALTAARTSASTGPSASSAATTRTCSPAGA